MQVHGREVDFLFTVGASVKISELCPDGDLSRLGELLEGQYGQVTRDTATIIAALNEGYELAMAFEAPGYKPQPLTADELLALSFAEFGALQKAALEAWRAGNATTVEVEPEKKESGEDRASS